MSCSSLTHVDAKKTRAFLHSSKPNRTSVFVRLSYFRSICPLHTLWNIYPQQHMIDSDTCQPPRAKSGSCCGATLATNCRYAVILSKSKMKCTLSQQLATIIVCCDLPEACLLVLDDLKSNGDQTYACIVFA